MSDKWVSAIWETMNYDKFKILKGQRDVTRARVEKIKKSISKRNIGAPIQVNEKFEVIDGQGRLQALRELGLPVRYYILQGAGIEDCRLENRTSTNWSIKDAIKSYADCGSQEYAFLNYLYEKYSMLPNNVILYAIAKENCKTSNVMDGSVVIGLQESKLAIDLLEYIKRFVPYRNKIAGRSAIREFYFALAWTYAMPGVDNERLFEKVSSSADRGEWRGEKYRAGTVLESLESLEKVYNYRTAAGNKAYILEAYKKAKDNGKRWFNLME